MRHIAIAALLVVIGSASAEVDVGTIDQKAPAKEALAVPKKDDGATVGLTETVAGKVAAAEKRNLYVIVRPLSGNDWWVQQSVTKSDGKFSADAQFGEGDNGVGEHFAILAVATDKTWAVGDKFTDLPADAGYSKPKIVKRK